MKRSYLSTVTIILMTVSFAVAQNPGPDPVSQLYTDTDLDGIADIEDIDDDNDGILDIIEVCGEFGSMTELTQLRIVINTDSNPDEISWEIEGSGGHVAHGGPYDQPNTEYIHEIDLGSMGNYWFAIDDSEGNGMESQGSYKLYLNDHLIHDGDGSYSYAEVVGIESYEAFISCIASDPSGDDDNDGIVNYRDSDYCALNASGTCRDMDADKDGIPNFLDLDSDNDALPDLIESQLTTSFYTLYNIDNDNDGLDDAFDAVIASGMPLAESFGIGPVDTDGDGTYDFLDVDSDNDGVYDEAESGYHRVHMDTDGDGLDNAVDPVEGYLRPEGVIIDPVGLPDMDDDVYNGGDVDYRDYQFDGATETEEEESDAANELISGTTLTAYPNPVMSEGTVRIGGLDNDNVEWNLISMDGLSVASSNTDRNGSIELSPLDLKSGVYVLQVMDGGVTKNTQLLIAK